MMAKMFYTMEEAKAALGKSEEEIKQYAREGRLREFRDGPRLMFKADQVEQLKGELGDGGAGAGTLDQVDLGMSDSGGLIGLVDTTGASGTSITLSDADTGQSPGGGLKMKGDTALAADLGLSGSLGGVPSPGRPGGGSIGGSPAMIGGAAPGSGSGLGGLTGSGLSGGAPGTGLSGTGLSGGAGRTGAGINVFGTDDVIERVDPSAQTAITGGIREQIELQGVGSGSGLLDLTRESDDTSLGAVLDEITPGGAPMGRRVPSFDSGEGSLGGAFDDAPAVRVSTAPPVYIQAPDPLAPAFGGAVLAAAGVAIFGAFVLISSVLGTYPAAVKWFKAQNLSLFMIAGIGLGASLVFFVFGLILGKLTQR